MADQAEAWSRAAPIYEAEFIDPHRPDVASPLPGVLRRLADPNEGLAADLGCGTGPLLPLLSRLFYRVHAVDFASGMLERARQRARGLDNITFHQTPLTDLTALGGPVDVAVAVNSLVMPRLPDIDASLRQVAAILRPGGTLVGIVPAMDSVHYLTMLLVDRALAAGKPLEAAQRSAAHFNEHACYDFAFGQYRWRGLEQHFWQPFEVRYRLRRAGFRNIRLGRVRLAWEQFACQADLKEYPPPWDWFFRARTTTLQ
jgi:SAM-dependent methyltransferase